MSQELRDISSWDDHGPKYVLFPNEGVKYAGHFDDSRFRRFIRRLLNKSSLYSRYFQNDCHITQKDIERYVAIVVASKAELLKKFPGLEFHVIYWESDEMKDQVILTLFQHKGIKVHLGKDILPERTKKPLEYQIAATNEHPNFTANKGIANYIIQNILK